MKCKNEKSGPLEGATAEGKQFSKKWHNTDPTPKRRPEVSSIGWGSYSSPDRSNPRAMKDLSRSAEHEAGCLGNESLRRAPNYLFEFKLKEVGVLLMRYSIRAAR